MTDLPAGPDIDHQVVRAIGWGEGRDYFWARGQVLLRDNSPFEPSRRIDHAWRVFEHLAQSDDVHVGRAVWSSPGDPYYECDVTDGEGKSRGRGVADSAPLAICRAALAAFSRRP